MCPFKYWYMEGLSWWFFTLFFPDNFWLLQQKTLKRQKACSTVGFEMDIYQGFCQWPNKKRQKSALSGSWSLSSEVLCMVLYVSGAVRKKSFGVLAHLIPAQRREKILYIVNTSNLFHIDAFVLMKDILNYVSQFSHTALKYNIISVVVVPFFWKTHLFLLE